MILGKDEWVLRIDGGIMVCDEVVRVWCGLLGSSLA